MPLSDEERYTVIKELMICPDCGSTLETRLMREVDPKRESDYFDDHVGLKCTGYDPKVNPPNCPYYIFIGERQ